MKMRLAVFSLAAVMSFGASAALAQETTQKTQKDATSGEGQHAKRHRMRGGDRGEHMQKMAQELGLSEDQKAQFKTIHEQQRTKAMELRNNESLTREQKMEQMKALKESTHSQIQNVLTADQQKKFSEMKQHHKGRMGKGMRGQGRRGGWGEGKSTTPGQTQGAEPKKQ
ncbi:MAG TPA: hypothetical protein VM056_03600 [Terriglobales bacterium]|nr:hypothetical protein [Terriglobales bacterium]